MSRGAKEALHWKSQEAKVTRRDRNAKGRAIPIGGWTRPARHHGANQRIERPWNHLHQTFEQCRSPVTAIFAVRSAESA